MMLAAFLLAAALAASDAPRAPSAGAATPVSVSGVSIKPAAKDRSQEVVCQDEQEMDSLFFHRVCATREVWDARRRQDLEDWNHQRDQAGKAPGAVMRY